MLPRGIEPLSTVLQTAAMTTSAKVAYLEQREGFEPPVLRICNPLHWAALPPLHVGGNDWTRTSNTLRMKEEDYHCPTLPYMMTQFTILYCPMFVCAMRTNY